MGKEEEKEIFFKNINKLYIYIFLLNIKNIYILKIFPFNFNKKKKNRLFFKEIK